MKSLVTLFLVSAFVTSEPNLSSISKALGSGDTATLSSFLDNEVTISILDEEGIYTKAEATSMLEDFFNAHQVQSFVQMHQGQSKGQDSQYCIGNLKAGANVFRVYIFMKVSDSDFVIQELRFNQE